jgi:hypothetical protein
VVRAVNWKSSRGRGRVGCDGLGWDLSGDVVLADSDSVGGHGTLDDADNTPALETTKGASLHDLDLVANFGVVLLIVNVHDGLAIDDLMVKRVRGLVRDGDLDRLVARTAGDETDEGFARVARTGSDGGHGVGAIMLGAR